MPPSIFLYPDSQEQSDVLLAVPSAFLAASQTHLLFLTLVPNLLSQLHLSFVHTPPELVQFNSRLSIGSHTPVDSSNLYVSDVQLHSFVVLFHVP